MATEVSIYTKSNCVNCDRSKALMNDLGIEYNEISIEADPAVLEFLKSEGYMQAPVLMTDEDTWTGFNPEKIKALVGGGSATEDDDWDF